MNTKLLPYRDVAMGCLDHLLRFSELRTPQDIHKGNTTMRNKRVKGYWSKKKERYSSGSQARSRAKLLRTYEHIAHVTMDKVQDEYVVAFSIAKWYEEDCKKAGIKL